jgi:hypothetical protein
VPATSILTKNGRLPDEGCQASARPLPQPPRKLLNRKRRRSAARTGMSVAASTAVQKPLIVSRPSAPAATAVVPQPAETRMILVVGANQRLMEWAALSLFRAGHIPVVGQWFWPLVTGEDAQDGEIDVAAETVSDRLLGRCDALLRVDGPASHADAIVAAARARGLRVFTTLDEAVAG